MMDHRLIILFKLNIVTVFKDLPDMPFEPVGLHCQVILSLPSLHANQPCVQWSKASWTQITKKYDTPMAHRGVQITTSRPMGKIYEKTCISYYK